MAENLHVHYWGGVSRGEKQSGRSGTIIFRFNSSGDSKNNPGKSGRGERIRTSGLYVPNVALYQAKLHPDSGVVTE